jgi:hypothetical protein
MSTADNRHEQTRKRNWWTCTTGQELNPGPIVHNGRKRPCTECTLLRISSNFALFTYELKY